MLKSRASLLVLGFLCAAAAPVAAQDAGPAKVETTSIGKVFATAQGMTLYWRDSDKNGQSSCNGRCATLWPPFKAASNASANGDWTIIKRTDGSMQWAYKSKPVYTWSKDKKPGDVTGNGVAKMWHAAQPA